MSPDKLNVYLADDDEEDRLLFKEAFEVIKIKHRLAFFNTGTALLSKLKSCTDVPHVIFLDINMPGKSGLQCLREIRGDERYKDTVIAICSISSLEDTIEEAFIEGANIYIRKTNTVESFMKILTEVVAVSWQYVTDGLNRENFIISY